MRAKANRKRCLLAAVRKQQQETERTKPHQPLSAPKGQASPTGSSPQLVGISSASPIVVSPGNTTFKTLDVRKINLAGLIDLAQSECLNAENADAIKPILEGIGEEEEEVNIAAPCVELSSASDEQLLIKIAYEQPSSH